MSNKITISLDYPFESDGHEYKSITLRRPRASDIKKMGSKSSEIEKTFKLISDLGEISPDVIDSMDAADFIKVSEEIARFLES